jgi:hypothetical protein
MQTYSYLLIRRFQYNLGRIVMGKQVVNKQTGSLDDLLTPGWDLGILACRGAGASDKQAAARSLP